MMIGDRVQMHAYSHYTVYDTWAKAHNLTKWYMEPDLETRFRGYEFFNVVAIGEHLIETKLILVGIESGDGKDQFIVDAECLQVYKTKLAEGQLIWLTTCRQHYSSCRTWAEKNGLTNWLSANRPQLLEDYQDSNRFRTVVISPYSTEHKHLLIGVEHINSRQQYIMAASACIPFEQQDSSRPAAKQVARPRDFEINSDGTVKKSEYQTSGYKFL